MSRYCRCGTALAADNTDRLCSLCQATRQRGRAPDVPPEFWQTDTMAAALASGDLGRVIRAYRCHPFHGQRLPQALLAGWLHTSQAAVCRIENGRRRVTIDEIAQVARALGIPVALPWAPEHPAGEDVDPLSRRSLLGAGVGAAVGLSATTAPTAAREIDPELVSHWLKLLRVLGRHDAAFGPHEVVASVRHELGLIGGHRRIARGELHTQLVGVEARWAWFASWLSHDTGDWRRRDSWTARALQLAEAAGDQHMVAWVLMWQSRWAAMRHDASRAIMLADAARHTRGTTDTIRGLCALRVAHGHALAKDAVSCQRSLADSYSLLNHAAPSDHATPWDDLGRQNLGSPPCVLADEARCWLSLQPHKAVAMFDEVLRLWPRDRTRGRGIQHARLALACAAANDVDRAAVEGLSALEIARATKSDTTIRELKRLDHRLAGCDAPAAADFRDAIAAL
ncbi:MAG: helix-turn-helix domain-containing protein [Actinobacteria bacterium]|nr:helix-turn-helix domain-containing protein [Actinomycetota bacterium]